MSRLILLFLVVLFIHVGRFASAISPENVLVLYNDDPGQSGTGFQIASHYQQARPGVHMAPLTGIDAVLTGAFGEDISGQDYLDVIRPQVLSAIAAIPEDIEVIVTTKGMPLRIDVGSQPVGNTSSNWQRFSSLESELTRVDSIDTTLTMGDQKFLSGFHVFDTNISSNPYFFDRVPFTRSAYSSGHMEMRLTSRLDGYSIESVKNSIDRAQKVFIVPTAHEIVLDDTGFSSVDQITNSAGLGPGTFELITNRYPDDGATNPVPVHYENTNTAVTSSSRQVFGYVSHGTNDGPSFGLSDNYLGGFVNGQYVPGEVQFQLANGAVFHTHESFNSQSFDPNNTQADGLIADWIEVGGTAGLGHVAEPTNGPDNVTNEDLFYEMLLPAGGAGAAPGEAGLTFVESAWNATRQLSFVNTVVGDPLMTVQAWLPGDTNLDGKVEFNDFYTLQGNWQQEGTFADGDFTGDGFIDQDDFIILQGNWLTTPAVDALSEVEINTSPIQDPNSGFPVLAAWLTSSANLNGDLNVDGEDLAILEASYAQDSSGDIDGDGLTTGLDFLLWQQHPYTYDVLADFDFDARVTSSDGAIWQNSYAKNLGGDVNDDGRTDGLDFLLWQQEVEFDSVSQSSGTTATPEPGSLMLASLGFLGLIIRPRKESRKENLRLAHLFGNPLL